MLGWILAVTVAREVEGRMVFPSVEPVGTNPSTETPVLVAQGIDDVICQSAAVLVVSVRDPHPHPPIVSSNRDPPPKKKKIRVGK